MKIVQLEYFIEVVNRNSFTKAAQALHISQPSLTATIKKMEHDLGYQLLKRSTKEMTITEKGIQFYNHAVTLVQQYHQTMERMYDLKLSQTPKIKMSTIESTAYWVSLVIQQHHQKHPDQHYQITETLNPEILAQKLVNFELHLGISNDQIRHEDVVSIPLYEEDYVLLVPEDRFTQQKSISIKGLPLIVPNKPYQVRKHIEDYFTHLEERPNIVMEVERFEAATNFVHQGMGYAVIPRVYYQSRHTQHLSAIKIRPTIKRTIYINYARHRQYGSHVQDLVAACQHYWGTI
ncbi:LysR family transcriptional regulator [Staphylococcus muscae]|uniref:LysR family transcriptional regulator n=1 Tax=Staphylococcus muscae TaxID=1294 RepID=A0A240C7T8_9STAP|nr:LysR family transcriptional regulator [Staphylococcus muscae]AVQ33711.1 LysR family transcriptional regulator [Staphylococcus muscae]PNZ03626.1 LysR family transcriptional regulator [Staphylococcus muscae]GGA87116.1 LysR family transcriptional regulator [Staphylococcus muscae]SNW04054.1 LysR family transcriptional regulator [Staphylococcus muscae]